MTDPDQLRGNRSSAGDYFSQDSPRGTQDRSSATPVVGTPSTRATDRLGKFEVQTDQEVVQAEITIGQESLNELRKNQSALQSYVKGYIHSFAEVNLVMQVRSFLNDEMLKSEATTQYGPAFWLGLRDRLGTVKPLSTQLNFLLEYDDLRPQFDAFDTNLITAREQIQRAVRSYKGIDLNGIATDVDQTIEKMLGAINPITEVCQTNTDNMLGNLKSMIDKIFGRIEERRRLAAAAQRQPEAWGKAAPEGFSSARPGAVTLSSDESTRNPR